MNDQNLRPSHYPTGKDLEPVVELASRLISCPSITPKDAGAQAVLIERLTAVGFSVTPIVEGESTAFWAELITDGKPMVVFAGHTDVVPAGDPSQWASEPFTPTIRDGHLFGRGAADMKGNIASFIVALEEFIRESAKPLPISLGVIISGDEEGAPNCGTENVIKHLQSIGRTIDFCINAEPTSVRILGDTVKNGRRGACNAFIRINGKQGHSAYPELAKNPFHLSLPAFQEIINYDWDRGFAGIEPKTSLQITSVTTGTTSHNVIPGALDVCCNIRFPVRLSPEHIQEEIEGILRSHSLDFSIRWNFFATPFQTPNGRLLEVTRDAIKQVTGVDTVCSAGGGTSDARFIALFCREVLELGLVGSSIHAVDEHAAVADMITLKDIFKTILVGLSTS
jgi:succinyl-diaminopimelate desuccinylase